MPSGKIAVISGCGGQAGFYLASHLLSLGYVVVGIKRRTSLPNDGRLQYLKHSNLFIENGDITDASSIRRIISKYMPDEFYHLAAQSHVAFSFESPKSTEEINCGGTVNVLEALREVKRDCKFLFSASSEMFGDQLNIPQSLGPEYIKLDENSPMQARSPYGASKIFGYNLTKHYREAYDMFACSSINFNFESPLRGENFVTRKITKSIADIIQGRSEFITLGNIHTKRDWSFAGDTVMGMYLILRHSEPDDFVLASGESYSVEEFLKHAIMCWNQGDLDLDRLIARWVKIDSKFYRPTDIGNLVGDSSKAHGLLGWEPKFSFDDLVKMMVDFDLYGSRKYINDALYLKENFNG